MVNNLKKEIFDKYNIKFDEIRKIVEPYIVEFYGQDKKGEIANRLDKVVLNNYFTLEDIKSFVRKYLDIKRRKLTLDFLEEFAEKEYISSEDKEKKIFNKDEYNSSISKSEKKLIKGIFDSIDNTFSETNFSPIYKFFKDKEEEISEYEKSDVIKKNCTVLNALGLDITPESYEEVIKKESSQEIIKKAIKIKEFAIKLKEEFSVFSMQFEAEEQYFKECDELKNEIDLKEIKAFYNEILPFVDEETKKNVQEALNEDIKEKWKFLQRVDKDKKYMGTSLDFSGEIKNKNFDISKENIEKIEECRIKHKEAVDEDFYMKTSSYYNNAEIIESLGLKVEDDFDLEFMKEGVVCCCPNYIEKDGKEEAVCLMHLPLYNNVEMLSQYKDTIFIHELLHIVEMTSKKIDDETYEFKSGFDRFQEKVKGKEVEEIDEDEKRDLELFSENIHQRNAMEITQKMHDEGDYLFNNKYDVKVKGGTTYEYNDLVTDKFYKSFKKQINEARFLETIEPLTNEVGIENFEELNNIVNEFAKIPYVSVDRDLRDGKITELTIKRDLLYEASKVVVLRMQEQYKDKPNLDDNISI